MNYVFYISNSIEVVVAPLSYFWYKKIKMDIRSESTEAIKLEFAYEFIIEKFYRVLMLQFLQQRELCTYK